jgi:hypothetical protein
MAFESGLGKERPLVSSFPEQLPPDPDLEVDGQGGGPAIKLGSFVDGVVGIAPGWFFSSIFLLHSSC